MPKIPWIKASIKETIAILWCHLNGIIDCPLLLKIAILAVDKKEIKVKIPRYIITGFPKIK